MPTTITGTDGVSQVQTGAVESGDLPAGSVIQVVQTEGDATVAQISTSSYVDLPGLSASITPQSSLSKILIAYSFHIQINAGSGWGGFGTQILRDFTVIVSEEDAPEGSYGTAAKDTNSVMHYVQNPGYLDSPNTTSLITYKVQGARVRDNGGSINYNKYGQLPMITLMEIAG